MNCIPIVDKSEKILYNRNERIEDYKQRIHESEENQIPSPDCVRDYSYIERWIEDEENLKTGDKYVVSLAAPGCGNIEYEITRIEENGDVFGVCISDYVMEFEEADVM